MSFIIVVINIINKAAFAISSVSLTAGHDTISKVYTKKLMLVEFRK